jgi:hypothetical protein
MSFEDLKEKLRDSLLFKSCDLNMLKEHYTVKHGTKSAISFLYFFYKDQTISMINIEQQSIIEISAIVMHEHTSENVLEYKNDSISYIMKLCDDLQEWERILIQFKDSQCFLKCNKCGKFLNTKETSSMYVKIAVSFAGILKQYIPEVLNICIYVMI